MHCVAAARRRSALGLAAVLVAATACGGDDGSASASGGGKVALTVNVFGNFGYEQLYKQFEAAHPNITITERGTGSDLSNYTPALTKNLAAGSGAGRRGRPRRGHHDPVQGAAAELRRPRPVRRQRRQGQLPALEVRRRPVRGRQQAHRPRHRRRLAWRMCYRRDLFAKAGLPTDRDEVGQALAELGRLRRPSASSSRPRTPAPSGSTRRPTRTTRSWCRRRARTRLHLLRQEQRRSSSTPTRRSSRRTTGRSTMIGDGLSAGYKSFSDRVERRLQEGHVRDDRLPGLDARLHPGPGR